MSQSSVSISKPWNSLSLNMFMKIATIALTAFIAIVAADEVWNGFVASWDLDTLKHFYVLPTTYEAAEYEGWTNVSGVDPPGDITALCFEDDPTFVLLFYHGKVIGCQVGVLVKDVENSMQPLQWNELDVIKNKTLNDQEFYTATVYFYNDEMNNTRRIWFEEKLNFTEITTNASLVPSETEFLMKNCIPTMGTHYYAVNSTTDCAHLNPWFLLANNDDIIIGVGFQGFGKPTTLGNRTWWETILPHSLYYAISDPPTCQVDAIEEYGSISLHIWFVADPQNITCSESDDSDGGY